MSQRVLHVPPPGTWCPPDPPTVNDGIFPPPPPLRPPSPRAGPGGGPPPASGPAAASIDPDDGFRGFGAFGGAHQSGDHSVSVVDEGPYEPPLPSCVPDPPEHAHLSRDEQRWILSLDLTYPIRHPRRDLANGFLLAEVLSRYFPDSVSTHSFATGTSALNKARGAPSLYLSLFSPSPSPSPSPPPRRAAGLSPSRFHRHLHST